MCRALPTLALYLSLLTPFTAFADEFSDFRIPPHSVTSWQAGFAVQGNRASTGYPTFSDRLRQIRGESSTDWSWFHDSEPFTTSFAFNGFAADLRDWRSQSSGSVPGFYDQTNRRRDDAFERLLVQAEHRHHPWASAIGFRLRSTAVAFYGQSWDREHRETLQDLGNLVWTRTVSASETWRYTYDVSGEVMVGVGRVRDATGVYTARVLEDRLRQSGALARPLSREARQRLVDLMTVRFAYSAVHDRPGKDLWREVEAILVTDGALSEQGLDPRSVLRASEPHYLGAGLGDGLPSSPVTRLRGAFGGPLFTARHNRSLLRSDDEMLFTSTVNGVPQPPNASVSHLDFDLPFDEYMAGAGGEYHRPIGQRWQADLGGQVLAPVRSEDDGFLVSTEGHLAWLVADRWLAQASVQQFREIRETNNLTVRDDWWWSYGVGLVYYFEDRFAVQLAASEQQSDQSSVNYRFSNISLGVTYRLMGRFRAPGMMEVRM